MAGDGASRRKLFPREWKFQSWEIFINQTLNFKAFKTDTIDQDSDSSFSPFSTLPRGDRFQPNRMSFMRSGLIIFILWEDFLQIFNQ